MLEGMVADRLFNGERILWSGRPGQGIVLTGQDVFLLPFSRWGSASPPSGQ
jgi:hypothetical protein